MDEDTGEDIFMKKRLRFPNKYRISYTAKELAELRKGNFAQTWPSFLDECFKNDRGLWDPDRWHQNRKRGNTPPPDEKKSALDRPSQATDKVSNQTN